MESEKPGQSKEPLYFSFDTKELLKGGLLSRYQAYKTALDGNFLQIDEVRYMEDKPPLGLNFVKLGLQDVLYEPETNTVYTPNTNKTTDIKQFPMVGGGTADESRNPG